MVEKQMRLIPYQENIASTIFGYISQVKDKLYINNRYTSIGELKLKKKAIDIAGLLANTSLDNYFQNKAWSVYLNNVSIISRSNTNVVNAYVLN
jgi:hypothetical protein